MQSNTNSLVYKTTASAIRFSEMSLNYVMFVLNSWEKRFNQQSSKLDEMVKYHIVFGEVIYNAFLNYSNPLNFVTFSNIAAKNLSVFYFDFK